MVRHGRDRRRNGYAGLVALLLLLAVFSFSPASATAQETVQSVLEPRTVVVGETFSLLITASGLPVGELSIDEPDYPEEISKRAGASIEESPQTAAARTNGDGVDADGVEIEVPFRATEAGRVIIEPVVLRDEQGNTWQTNRHLLEIARSESDPSVPFDVSWSVAKDTVYEGQTVPVFLNIENATEFSFPEEIAVEQPGGAVFQEVEGLGSVDSEMVDEVELLRYPVATFLMTPSSEGVIRIPSARVGGGSTARRAAAREVTVQQLPDRVRNTLAVGDYSFSVKLSTERLAEGESTTLTMRAEGTGNLDFFQFPDVEAGEATVGTVSEQSDVEPVPGGLVGSREKQLRITPRSPGELDLVVDRFTWLDPDSGRVNGEGPFQFRLEVRAAEVGMAETRGSAPFEALSTADIQQAQPVEMHRLPVFYLLFLPPFVAIVLAFAGVGVKRVGSVGMSALIAVPAALVLTGAAPVQNLPEDELETAVAALREGPVVEAKWRFEDLHEEYPRSPGILYNLGYASHLAEDPGTAVYALREALRIAPGFTAAREGLEWVEAQHGLDRQIQAGARVQPDTILVGLFVLAYVMGGLAVGVHRRNDARYAIGFLSTGLLMLAAVIFMLYTVNRARVPTAVIAEEQTAIRQVPVAEAKEWLTLPAGTAVRPRDEYGGYRLVNTGFGVEGWVGSDALLVSEP